MDKTEYAKLNSRLPVFFKSWWLDAVCEGGEWHAESVSVNGSCDSVFVYFIKQKFGLRYIVMPPLTQYLGEYIFSDDKSLKISKLRSNFYIKSLPKTIFTSLCMSHTFKYWSPYYWNGYNQIDRYSLIISNLSDLSIVFGNFDNSKQRNIRKAGQMFRIKRGLESADFYNFFKNSLPDHKVSYSANMFYKLVSVCRQNSAGEILYATDQNDKLSGALFMVWDSQTAYALTYAFPVEFRKLGGGDLLMYEAIKFASEMRLQFDFEGSMIKNIEQSYSRFGAEPVSYMHISKFNSHLFSFINYFKKLI